MTTALYYHPLCQLHEMGENHPESPARMQVIMDALKENGLDRVLEYRLSPEATEEDIRRVHTQDMILKVKNDIPAPGDYSYVDETPLNQAGRQPCERLVRLSLQRMPCWPVKSKMRFASNVLSVIIRLLGKRWAFVFSTISQSLP